MAVIIELFGYSIIEFLFTVPGAFLKWAYFKVSGKQTTFKECLTSKVAMNYMISILMVITVVLLIHRI